jgi:ABC-type Fe3+/spermidine/putrescine transport system ATPase subunit
MQSVVGQINEIIYLGMHTRYIVDAAGTQLIVAQQNTDEPANDLQLARGRAVRLFWRREHTHVLEG